MHIGRQKVMLAGRQRSKKANILSYMDHGCFLEVSGGSKKANILSCMEHGCFLEVSNGLYTID